MKFFQKYTFWLFLKTGSISIRCFWSHEKILFLAEVITGLMSVLHIHFVIDFCVEHAIENLACNTITL